jgi:uncharacterized Tic20 family protein
VPLILWIVKKDTSPYTGHHDKEALNFQLSLLLYSIVSGVLIVMVIGIFLLAGLRPFGLVTVIIAAVRAKADEPFRYPLA